MHRRDYEQAREKATAQPSFLAMRRLQNLNFYEVLEVSPNASQREIRRAYERAKKMYHPDSVGIYSLLDEDEIEELAGLIEEAYQTIGDENARREYDKALGRDEVEKTRPAEPSFYQHLSHLSDPLYPEETEPLRADYREKIQEMISHPDFEYTGEALRRIRETLGFDLKEISVRTKVSRANLDFIEAENYAHLPALVYLKGFVSEYARCLGLDPPSVLEDYVRRYRAWERERDM